MTQFTLGDLRSHMANKHYLAAALASDYVDELPAEEVRAWLLRELARQAPETLFRQEMHWALTQASRVWRPDSVWLAVSVQHLVTFDKGLRAQLYVGGPLWVAGLPCDCPHESGHDPSIYVKRLGIYDSHARYHWDEEIVPQVHGVISAYCEECGLTFLHVGLVQRLLTTAESTHWEVMTEEESTPFCEQLLAASAAREKKQAQEEE